MTGSTPSGAYHIPTVLEGSDRGWSRVWVPVVTAAIVLALGFLMVAATKLNGEANAVPPPAEVEAVGR